MVFVEVVETIAVDNPGDPVVTRTQIYSIGAEGVAIASFVKPDVQKRGCHTLFYTRHGFFDGEQAIFERRSVRNFKEDPVPEHLVRRVIEAGRFAPSDGPSDR